jgi:hypothetical protein
MEALVNGVADGDVELSISWPEDARIAVRKREAGICSHN